MGDEGAHADHVDVVLFEKQDVVRKIFEALARKADHHACSHLIAGFAQEAEAIEARLKALLRRMDSRKKGGVRCFDA